MNGGFPYKSLHDYLDVVFKDKTPDENEIIEAKKLYWKSYNTFLKQNQRKKHKEVTIAFEKQHWETLSKERRPGQTIQSHLKELLLKQIGSKDPVKRVVLQDTVKIEQQLFLITDYLESMIYHRRFIDAESIRVLEKHLLQLRRLLEDLF